MGSYPGNKKIIVGEEKHEKKINYATYVYMLRRYTP